VSDISVIGVAVVGIMVVKLVVADGVTGCLVSSER